MEVRVPPKQYQQTVPWLKSPYYTNIWRDQPQFSHDNLPKRNITVQMYIYIYIHVQINPSRMSL